mmetsp:Transcript_96663/g.171937  ORF Transcript_96663/g.171937 Transcript_96663/m.171937 type:complete len:240 (+) Transcript_96663:1696-2415(+)
MAVLSSLEILGYRCLGNFMLPQVVSCENNFRGTVNPCIQVRNLADVLGDHFGESCEQALLFGPFVPVHFAEIAGCQVTWQRGPTGQIVITSVDVSHFQIHVIGVARSSKFHGFFPSLAISKQLAQSPVCPTSHCSPADSLEVAVTPDFDDADSSAHIDQQKRKGGVSGIQILSGWGRSSLSGDKLVDLRRPVRQPRHASDHGAQLLEEVHVAELLDEEVRVPLPGVTSDYHTSDLMQTP